MAYHRFLKPTQWIVGLFLVVGMCVVAAAQQAVKKSDADLTRWADPRLSGCTR